MPKSKKSKSKKDASSRGVRKHLRELERQLTDAARQEIKRVRKLEKARNRRQELQAAVEQLRFETGTAGAGSKAKTKPATKPAAAGLVAEQPPAAPAAKPAAKPAARPAAVGTARTPRTSAAKPAAPKPAARAAAAPKPKAPSGEA